MRKHRGMRPQDIAILLKIIVKGKKQWFKKDLANELYLSQSEVSESLSRSVQANLLDDRKTQVRRKNLLEFIQHGLSYVFPAQPGTMVKGMPTAHAHPFMQKHIASALYYVWPDFEGTARGLAIAPLYEKQVNAVRQDEQLYKFLALIDVLRVGKTREKTIAKNELEKLLLNGA